MSNADCTPGHEPRSVAASSALFLSNVVNNQQFYYTSVRLIFYTDDAWCMMQIIHDFISTVTLRVIMTRMQEIY